MGGDRSRSRSRRARHHRRRERRTESSTKTNIDEDRYRSRSPLHSQGSSSKRHSHRISAECRSYGQSRDKEQREHRRSSRSRSPISRNYNKVYSKPQSYRGRSDSGRVTEDCRQEEGQRKPHRSRSYDRRSELAEGEYQPGPYGGRAHSSSAGLSVIRVQGNDVGIDSIYSSGGFQAALESKMVIKYRDKKSKRIISKGSIAVASLPVVPVPSLSDIHAADGETCRRLSAFLGGNPPKLDYHGEAVLYLAPVHIICVRWFHPLTGKYKYNVGHAFAFGHRFLFTADHLVQPGNSIYRFDGVYLTDSRNPFQRTNILLDVFYRCSAFDCAILESKIALFQRLELHPCGLQTFERVYHVDYLERNEPVLHSGVCYTNSADAWELIGRSNAKNDNGYSGGPVVLSNGFCIGMHIQGGDIDSSFVTTEGLALALELCHKEKNLEYGYWGIKFFACKGNLSGNEARSRIDEWTPNEHRRGSRLLELVETVSDPQLSQAECAALEDGEHITELDLSHTQATQIAEETGKSESSTDDRDMHNQSMGFFLNHSPKGISGYWRSPLGQKPASGYWGPKPLNNSMKILWKDD